MSFLNKIKGMGRKDSAEMDTLEQDRFDEPTGRGGDLPLPGAGGAATMDLGTLQQTAQMDSSIITEAAPSEMAEFGEARNAGPESSQQYTVPASSYAGAASRGSGFAPQARRRSRPSASASSSAVFTIGRRLPP